MTSKRRLRRRSCTGKVRYASEARCQEAARQLRDRDGRPVDCYACRFCHGFFHVGHRPGIFRSVLASRRRAR